MRSPRLLLLCAGLGSALLLALSTPLAAQHPLPPPPPATNVTAGGATATSVTQSGSTTNVTTGTVSGGNAYNQFSSFQVANGTTVNLNIPTAATNNNLLNLINDPTKTPTQIFGIVNSLLSDGSIGGNVYFADPNGVVIGATGAVNVGSLTLATPSSDFVANFFNDVAGNTSQLIAGTEPLTSDGLIAVLGQIHSVGPTSLQAAAVDVSGSITTGAAQFAAAVNTTGLLTGQGITIQGSTISIDGGLYGGSAPAALQAGTGDINVNASASDSEALANAVASITVGNASLGANNINLGAKATTTSDDSILGTQLDPFSDNSSFPWDITGNAAENTATSKATVQVGGSGATTLAATGNVNITAEGDTTTKIGTVAPVGSFSFGSTNATATATLASDANVTAGGAFDLAATINNTLKINPSAIGPGTPAAAAAVGEASSDSSAALAGTVRAATVGVTANNTDSFSTSAGASAADNGLAGISAAIGLYSAQANASLSGSAFATGADTIANSVTTPALNVSAVSNNQTDQVQSSSSVSDDSTLSTVTDSASGGIPFLGRLADFLSKLPKSKQPNSDSDPSPLALSAAVSYLTSSNSASTSVTGTASSSGGSAGISSEADDLPQIDAAGTAGGAKASIGGGVAFGTYSNTATTTVSGTVTGDQGVSITATASMPNPFSLSAFTSIPGEFDNLNFVAPSSFTDGGAFQQDWNSTEALGGDLVNLFDPNNSNSVAQFLNDNLGIGNVVTSFVNTGASAEGGKNGGSGFGLAGSVNILSLTNKASATVASGADIQAPHGAVNVNADANAYLINVVGMAASLGQLEGKNPGAKGDGALGGSYNGVSLSNSATASVDDGALVQSGGAVNVQGDSNETLINITQAGDNAGKFGINGTFAWIALNDTALGYIESNATVNAGGDVNVNAANNLTDFTISGALGYGGAAEVGATVGWNAFTNNVDAYIGDPNDARAAATGEVTSGGNVNVQALSNETLWNISLAAEAATGQQQNGTGKADQNEGGGQQEEGGSGQQAKFGIGISGNVSINDITDTTLAFINNGAQVLTDGNIGISAQDTSWAVSAGLAAALATKGKTAIALAGAFARNDFSKTTSAYADNAVLAGPVVNNLFTDASSVGVDANASGDLLTISAGGSVALGSNGISLAGSVNNNVLTNTTSSGLGAGVLVDASGNAKATAEQADKILSIAGSLSIGGKAGIGAALDFSTYNNTNDAFIGSGAQINAGGDVIASATTSEELLPIAASLDGGQGFGISGSASKDEITNTTDATVDGKANVDAGGQLQVKADDSSKLLLIVGSLGGGSSAGVGLAGAISIESQPLLDREVNAVVDNGAQIQAQSVNIAATQEGSADTIVAGIGGAETAGIAASLALNYFTEDTVAQIQNGANVSTTGDVALKAADSIQTLDVAGEIAGAGTAALGASADVEFYNRNVSALLGGTINAGGNVTVDSSLSASMWSVAAAASLAGTGDLAGAASAILGSTNTTAAISPGANVSANDTIALTSERSLSLKTIDGQLGISAEVGVGGAVSVVSLANSTVSDVGADATVTAFGNGSGLNELTDFFGAPTPAPVRGLAVTANSGDTLLTIAAGGQITTGISVAGSIVLNQIASTTEAYIDTGAAINPEATQSQASNPQAVDVLANDGTTLTSAAGALAAGIDLYGVGVGAAVNLEGAVSSLPSDFSGFQGVLTTDLNGASTNTSGIPGGFTKTVLAGVNNGATVNALGALSIAALSSENLTSYDGSVAGGIVGVAGTVEVDDYTPNTLAYFGSCTSTTNCTGGATGAVGSAEIEAHDNFEVNSIVGDIGLGGAALGASVLVSTVAADTQAYVGADSNLTAANALDIHSSFYDTYNAVALAGGAGVLAVNVPYAAITDQSTSSAFIADNAVVASTNGTVSLEGFASRQVAGLSGAAVVAALGAGASILDVSYQGGASATIGNGGSVNAGQQITLDSELFDSVPEFLPANFANVPGINDNTIPTGILGASVGAATGIGGEFDLLDNGSNSAAAQGSALTAGGLLGVTSLTSDSFYTAGAGLNIAGLSASGDIVNLTSKGSTSATLAGNDSSNSIDLTSTELETMTADATGIGGGALAADGDVATINDTSSNKASQLNQDNAAGNASFQALTTRNATATAGNTVIGALAGGVAFADVNLDGSTKAAINGAVIAGTGATFTLKASSNDTANVTATASLKGGFNGAGAIAGNPDGFGADPSRIDPLVQATLNGGGSASAGALSLTADDTANLTSTVDGAFIGAVNIGFLDAAGVTSPNLQLLMNGSLSGGSSNLQTLSNQTATSSTSSSDSASIASGYFNSSSAATNPETTLTVGGNINVSGGININSDATNTVSSTSTAVSGAFNVVSGGLTTTNAGISNLNQMNLDGAITSTGGSISTAASSTDNITQNQTTGGTGAGFDVANAAQTTASSSIFDTTENNLAGALSAAGAIHQTATAAEDAAAQSTDNNDAVGAVQDMFATANSSVTSDVYAQVFGSGSVNAQSYNLDATITTLFDVATATAKANIALNGSGTANTDAEISANPIVHVYGNAQLTAPSLAFLAQIGSTDTNPFSNFSVSTGSNPTAGTSSATGSATANATNNTILNPLVNLDSGATLTTSNLLVQSLEPGFVRYSDNPSVSGTSVVTWVATQVEETVDEVLGWIPGVKEITKWVTEWVEQITDSTTNTNNFGTLNANNNIINFNATLKDNQTGDGASLTIGANGQPDSGSGVSIQNEDNSNILIGNVVNNNTLAVVLDARGGTVNGTPTIEAESMLPFVDITNDSNKNLVLQQIAPISTTSSNQPVLNVTAENDNLNPTFLSNQNPSAVSIINNGTGSVVFDGNIQDQLGSVTVTNAGGDILQALNTLIQVNQLGLDAPHGSIGSAAGAALGCAFCPGASAGSLALGALNIEPDEVPLSGTTDPVVPTVTAVAHGDINMVLTPFASNSGGPLPADVTVDFTNILAGGNVNLTLNPAQVQGIELKTETIDLGIFGTISFTLPVAVNGPAANTVYSIGAGQWLAGGGNVNLNANGSSSGQVTLQDNGLLASGFAALNFTVGPQGQLSSLVGADGQVNASFLNYLQNFNDPSLLANLNASTGGHIALAGSGVVSGNGAMGVLLGGSQVEITNNDAGLNFATQALGDNGVSASTINIFGANEALSGTLAGSSVSLGHYGQSASVTVASQGGLSLDGLVSASQGSVVVESMGDLNSVNGNITAGTQAILLSEHGGIDAGAVTVLNGFLGAEAANTLEADHGIWLALGNANLTSDHGDIVVGALEATGNDQLNAVGNLQAQILQAGGNLVANAGGNINDQALITGGDAALTAGGALQVGVANVGGDANFRSGGDLSGNQLHVDGAATLTSGGTINLNSLTAGMANLDAAGNILADSITAGGDANAIARAGDLEVINLAAGGNANLTAAGELQLNNANVGGGAAITSGGDTLLGSLIAGGSVVGTAGGSITWGSVNPGPQNLSAGGNIALTAQHDISFANAPVTAGGNATLTAERGSINWGDANPGPIQVGGDLIATAGQSINGAATEATVGRDATLSAQGGSINWGDLTAGGNANLTAKQSIIFSSIVAGNDAVLAASRNVSDGSGINAAHDAIVTAGADITLDSVIAGNDATLTAGQDVNLGVVTATAGTASITATAGNVNLGGADAQGNPVPSSVTAGLDAILAAGSNINAAAGAITAGRDAALTAGQDINLGAVAAGRNASLTAGHDVYLGSVSAGNDLTLIAGNNLNGSNGVLSAGHDLTVTVGNDLSLGTATAGHDATLTAGHNLNLAVGGTVTAGDTASLTTLGGDINLLGTVTAPTDLLTAYGNIFAGPPSTGLVIGHTIALAAETGAIGTIGNDLNLWMDSVQGATPTLTAAARGDINLNLTATNRDGVAATESDEPSGWDRDPRLFADITNLYAGGDLNLNLNPGISNGAAINAWYEIPFGDAALVGGTANVNLTSPAWDFDAVTFDADGTLGSGFSKISYTVNADGSWTSTVTASDGSSVTGLVNFASSIGNGVINLSDINADQGGTINLTGTGQLGSGSHFAASSGPTSVTIANNDANLLLQSNNITMGFGAGEVNINELAHGRFFNGTGIVIVPDEFGPFFFGGNGDDRNGHDGDNNDPDDRAVPTLKLSSADGINLNGTISNPYGPTTLQAQGSIGGPGINVTPALNATATGDIALSIRGDLDYGSFSGVNINLAATGSIGDDDHYVQGIATGLWTLSAGDGLYLATPANANIASLAARDAELQVNVAGGSANIAQANILDALDVDADTIAIGSLTHSDPVAPLHLSLQGYRDGMAQNVTASVTSSAPVLLEYASQNGAVQLTGDWLDVDDAIIGQAATFSNNWLKVALVNTDPHGHAQSADLDFVGNRLDLDASHSLAQTVSQLRVGQTFTLPTQLTPTEYWMAKELR